MVHKSQDEQVTTKVIQMKHYIIDRRKNPKGKSVTNRQKFIEKYKKQIKEVVKKSIKEGKIQDIGNDGAIVTIPKDNLSEPNIDYDRKTGKKDLVVPHNPGYNEGDTIEKPKGGGGNGTGKGNASGSGEGEDQFQFKISRDEFFDLLFEDLELPNLVKKKFEELEQFKLKRAGFKNRGDPVNLDIKQTFRKSYMRRISLNRPDESEIEDLEVKIKNEKDENKKKELIRQLEEMKRKILEIPFLDNLDLKLRNFEPRPLPSNRAVMFAIMDVSASMDEEKKTISKIFFLLLYTFLRKKYDKVEIVFIRHHSVAEETNEEDFFHKKETGGTVVSSALELSLKIIEERYSPEEWNIYFSQSSDGDNYETDNSKVIALTNKILDICQYFAYIEIDTRYSNYDIWNMNTIRGETSLWKTYKKINNPILQMSVIRNRKEIWNVFRSLFSKNEKQ
jgi:uncharacterized sporulation protein YeaH/YhbH (DUF444 family)